MKAADRIAALEAELAQLRAEFDAFRRAAPPITGQPPVYVVPTYPSYSNVPVSYWCPICKRYDCREVHITCGVTA